MEHQQQRKGFLEAVLRDAPEIQDVIHYDENSRIITVEDPKFMFYIRNILWTKFAKQVGYASITFKSKYDFALSFAGENRNLAELIFEKLSAHDIAVFYDKNEQHRILAENVEDYLSPIYSSEAKFIVPLLSNNYPRKIWTKFESENFKQRFGEGSIIPVWYSDCTPGLFDESIKYGGITFNVAGDLETEAQNICDALIKKIAEDRIMEQDSEEQEA